jgi:hypothetical protein
MPGEFDAAINQALDDYQAMAAKAALLDRLVAMLASPAAVDAVSRTRLLEWIKDQVAPQA